MLKLYENIVIGNFLYGLGFAISQRIPSKPFPAIINLLQQTPDDTFLGDLVMTFPGVLRIVEFKQRSNNDKKEPERHKRLLDAINSDPRKTATSREVHWFVETAPTEKSFVSRIVPYLEAYPRGPLQHDFTQFINVTADAAVRGESNVSEDDLRQYLDLLAGCHGSGKIGSGGLVVKVSRDGSIGYVGLESFREILLKREAVINKILEQERALEAAQDIQLDRQQRQNTKNQGREMGRG